MMAGVKRSTSASGVGLVEILVVLLVVALAGVLISRYVGSTARQVERLQAERPLAGAKLVADQATAAAIRAQLQVYQAQHGQWPPDKAAALAVLHTPPRFQCPGNDFEYDPAGGQVRLLIADPSRC
jgi:type II secretory pathway pseudopilin PulG